MSDHDLDPILTRAFAHAAAPPDPARDAAFLARVRAGVAAVERRRRLQRRAAIALVAALMILVTPWVVQLSLVLARAALSPWGMVAAMGFSLLASWRAWRTIGR